jgi:hypothetical protein
MGADGQPQSSLAWIDHDGEWPPVNPTWSTFRDRYQARRSR